MDDEPPCSLLTYVELTNSGGRMLRGGRPWHICAHSVSLCRIRVSERIHTNLHNFTCIKHVKPNRDIAGPFVNAIIRRYEWNRRNHPKFDILYVLKQQGTFVVSETCCAPETGIGMKAKSLLNLNVAATQFHRFAVDDREGSVEEDAGLIRNLDSHAIFGNTLKNMTTNFLVKRLSTVQEIILRLLQVHATRKGPRQLSCKKIWKGTTA